MSTTFVRNTNVVASDMDGEVVMMSIERGEYFGVGDVGSRVWELLAKPVTVPELASAITAEFEVDEETARRDVQSFVDEMLASGLVTAV